MPDNQASIYDQLAPLIQQQQEIYKQRASALDQMTAPYANVDPVNQAYIGGLLAPTRSGSFFESLGNAVDAQRGVLSKLREDQMNQQDKIANLQMAQIKLALEAPVMQARAQWFSRRGMGYGATDRPLDIQKTIGNITKLEQMATQAETQNNLPLAQRYRAEAEKLRTGLMGVGATDVTGAQPEDTTTEDQSGGWWDTIKELGSNVAKGIAGQSGGAATPSISAGGVPPSQAPAPTAAPAAPAPDQTAAPAEGQPPDATGAPSLYKGSTPPKEFPNALRGRDGGWYVIKDGKPHPVLK